MIGNKYKTYRKNKVYKKNRNCMHEDCITILSQYNRFDFCDNHLPYRQPRVRGSQLKT